MKASRLVTTALSGLIVAGSLGGTATVARADTGSTIAIAGAAALIVGALLTDNSGKSYYVRDNQRHYVNHDTAVYYRNHHGNGNYNRGNMGRGNMNHGGNMGHGNMGHPDNMGHGNTMGNHDDRGDHHDHH